MTRIKEHDQVVLTAPAPADGLEAGDVGTVVGIYPDGAYEVEFVTFDGQTTAVATIEANAVRAVSANDMPHVRELVPTR